MPNSIRKMMGKVSTPGNWIPSSVNEEDCSIELVASTGSRGLRTPFFEDPYFEELSMDESSIRLERLNNGAPLLDSHDNSSLETQIGVVERAWLKEGKLYARVRFRSNEKSQAIFRDVAAGLVRNVSVGYATHAIEEKQIEGDEFVTRRATDWEPMEISLCPIGFDKDATVRGSEDSALNPVKITKIENKKPEPKTETRTQENNKTEVKKGKIEMPNVVKSAEEIRNEMLEMQDLGSKFDMPDLARTFIQNGRSASELKDEILKNLGVESRSHQQPENNNSGDIGLTPKEAQRFNFLGAIEASATRDWRGLEFEKEVSDSAVIQRGAKLKNPNSFLVPNEVLNVLAARNSMHIRKANTVEDQDFKDGKGKVSTGGAFVSTKVADSYIEMLADELVCKQFGAQVLSLSGPIAIPRETTGNENGYWIPSEITRKNKKYPSTVFTTDQVSLKMRTCGAYSDVTRDLIKQASISVEAFVIRTLTRKIARTIDWACLFGDGDNTAGTPLGIFNTEGVHKVTVGTGKSGGEVSLQHLIEMEELVANSNVDLSNLKYLTNSKVMARMKLKQAHSGINAGTLWQTVGRGEGIVNGYPGFYSNLMRSDMGTGKNLSCMLLGDFSQLVIGEFGMLEIHANPYTAEGFLEGMVRINCLASVDCALKHPESFSVIEDINHNWASNIPTVNFNDISPEKKKS